VSREDPETRVAIGYTGRPTPPGFWQNPWILLALILISGLPILMATVPPFTDLPGHMARYRVEMEIGHSTAMKIYYSFHWQLIGNLGVDLLILPLGKLFGVETGVKMIVFCIPVLTAFGFLWVAHEVHGRIPPTAFLALPFAYNYPFLFGFANFALSMALAFIAFGLWLRMGRLEQLRLRAIVFVPLSALLWVVHAYGWGTLGVLAFSAELVRQHDKGNGYFRSAWNAGVQVLSLTPPILLMLLWRSGNVAGKTGDWFNWKYKWEWIEMVLRDRWETFDKLSLLFAAFAIVAGAASPRLGLSRHLTASAIFLAVVYVLLPRVVLGSAYADMRLAPFIFAVALLAIRLTPEASRRFAAALAAAALIFFGVRTIATMVSFHLYDREWDRNLEALDHVPLGARLVSFVGRQCKLPWYAPHTEHLPGMAVVRRQAFSNDQWVMPGAQLIRIHYLDGWPFVADPSQVVVQNWCHHPREVWRPIDVALARVPRKTFDYVWLINPPRYDPALTVGMEPIWRNGSSVLFRIVDRAQPVPLPPPPAWLKGKTFAEAPW
jgi:hypothetical protein